MKKHRKTSHITRTHTTLAVALIALGFVVSSHAASVLPDDTAASELDQQAERTVISKTSDDGLLIEFGSVAGAVPIPASGNLTANLSVAEGAFVGNYPEAGVKGLTFDALLDGSETATISVQFRGAESGRVWWLLGVESAAVLGQGYSANVSLDMLAGWQWTGSSTKDTAARFAADLADVESIGLSIARGGEAAHTCTINSFKLLLANNVVTPDAVLEATLSQAFNGTTSVAELSESELKRDSDGDGIKDWQEIMSTQTDHLDADSAMKLSAVERVAAGVRVQWDSVINGQYDVLRSDNVAGPYNTVIVSGHIGTENGVAEIVDTNVVNGVGPYFYRVQKTN
jgi:hypothetical protein